jgi:dienelactone hydrolase
MKKRYVFAGVLLIAALIVAALLSAPTHPAGRAFLLTADLLLQTPASPLQWLTPAPVRSETRFGVSGEGLLFSPADASGPRPAVVLSAGFAPDLSDPLLNRLAADLARLGFVAFIPRTPALREGVLAHSDVDVLVEAFEWLEAQPERVRSPIGFAGFCVGGSLAFVAAADADIAPRVAYIHSFGGYCDARTELRAIRTGTTGPGPSAAWHPAPRAMDLFVVNLLARVETPAHRAAITAAVAAGSRKPPVGLSELDQLIARLLLTDDGPEFDALLSALPAAQRAELDAVSPCSVAAQIRGRAFIMHDTDDPYAPPSEAARLAAALPREAQPTLRYFTIFDHVQPERAGDRLQLASESLALMQHLREVLLVMAGG